MPETDLQPFSFPEVRVVEASAGSGKTYCLAKRYVQLLLDPRGRQDQLPIRNILAITFTNKAAFEMKRRILDFLKKIALEELSAEEEAVLLKPLGLAPKQAGVRAYRIMEGLIHHYNYFQVQTIDSFINALLVGCAFKVGLSASFKIRTNAYEYIEYSLDQLIERALTDPRVKSVFERFLHQYIFLENKPAWFPKKDILGLLYGLYRQSNTYGQDFAAFDVGENDLLEKKKRLLASMRTLKAEAGDALDGRFQKILDNFLGQYQTWFDTDKVSGFFTREDIPLCRGARVPGRVEDLWGEIRGQLCRLCEEEALTLFHPYVEMFSLMSGDFALKAKKDDVLFLEELNKKAKALFDEGAVTVEELYYRLATRFHHYLVDEFQDTSILQWQNLTLMVEEGLSTGGSLFYVGDKKQAIYGFRGGEVKLFDAVQDRYGPYNVRREQLARNYRSQKAVVEFNNSIFSVENLNRFVRAKEAYDREKKKDGVVFSPEEMTELENIFHGSRQEGLPRNDAGYVHAECVSAESKEDRDACIRDKLIARLRDVRQRFRLKDIALLTRSNDEIELLTGWLIAEGFSVESERTLNIKESRVVRDLVSFLSFLNSPIDNTAFARFILGDIFPAASGLTKEALQGFLLETRRKRGQEKDVYIYREFRARFPGAWETLIDEFFSRIGLYPLYELVISILRRFEVFDHFPGQQGFVMKFLELIQQEEEEYTDAGSFLDRFDAMESEALFVNMTGADAVRILTVHKAKGLEFPVVIVPFLGMRVKVGAGGGVGQLSYVLDFQEQALRLLRIKETYLKFSSRLYGIWRREYVRAFIFELNNIYVALTRAVDELYVFIPNKTANSHNPAQFLVPDGFWTRGQVRAPQRPAAAEEGCLRLSPPRYHDWLAFLQDEFHDDKAAVNREAALKGEAFHFMLSCLGNLSSADVPKKLAAAVSRARVRYPVLGDGREAGTRLGTFIHDERNRPFFFVEAGTVFQEQDVVDRQGRTRRLDRLIITPGEAWVVDYKSARGAEDKDRQQVRDYMDILAGIYAGRRVRGFLLYLDEGGGEEVQPGG